MEENKMNIYQKLMEIQSELEVPKSIHNKFADFNYRSLELILEKVKPICKKHNTILIITDEIKNIGSNNYVEAKAKLIDIENPENFIEGIALAKEPVIAKAKMDDSQTTGSTSSYARKYALNGLFCLDDNKDPDSGNPDDKKTKNENEENDRLLKVAEINSLIITTNADRDKFKNHFGIKDITELTNNQIVEAREMLKEKEQKKKAK